jgi:hypothetical protein
LETDAGYSYVPEEGTCSGSSHCTGPVLKGYDWINMW